ncbi:hypothetical protein [Frateuria terrea]|nr:hypothetical protein [Frateuria terrea]
MNSQPKPHRLAAAPKQGETGHAVGDNCVTATCLDLPPTPSRRTIATRQPHRIHAMAHRIDAEHDQEGGHGAVVSPRPGIASPAAKLPPVRPASLRLAQEEADQARKPIWDKNNFGFWLTVCILISLAFSVIWHAIG